MSRSQRMQPAVRPSTASPRFDPYLLAVLLLPVIVLWHQDNTLFTPPGYIDSWFYLGFFRDLAEFKRYLFPNLYYGSRLSWILPGYLVHSLFSPVVANCVLHLAVHSVATFSLFSVLRLTVGVRSAFLTAMVFCVNPWLWAATGSDYVDGAGIAYCLLGMALLTRAAVRPAGKWSLVMAGAALAGSIYTNLFWIALAPLLPLYYAALVWIWRRTPPIHSLASVCLWAGSGFGLVTVALGGINYLLDGHFWFYAPSFDAARQLTSTKNPWFQTIWYNHQLRPWLWFSAIATVAAIVLLPFRARKGAGGRKDAGLLLSVQLLLAVAIMEYTQESGTPVLGISYYASYLFPFAFLTIGSSFWAGSEKMGPRAFALMCCAAAALFAVFWYDSGAPLLSRWPVPSRETILLGGAVLALALALRRRSVGTLLALVGFVVFTVESRIGGAPDPHANRKLYERIMQARERVEYLRDGHPVWFWYDERDPDYSDYLALNSTYMAAYSRLGPKPDFPQHGCGRTVDPGTLIVVSSRNARAPEVARGILAGCWRASGIRPVVEEVDVLQPGDQPYTIAMLKADTDFSVLHPLRAVFDSTGKADLQLVENPTEPVPLPLDRWTVGALEKNLTSIRVTSAGLALRTPRAQYAAAVSYGPLIVPDTGRYRFALRYRRGSGYIAFGARPPDDSRYLATDIFGHAARDDREMAFWLDLKRGERILLRIANNNPHGDGAASFLMEELTAFELLNSAETQEEPSP
jgi:hypothetical protein